MALVCPACNKPNQAELVCQRCGCELGLLHAVCAAAGRALAQARAHLASQEWEEALGAAEQSWALCHTAEAARCAFMGAGAIGETEAALMWHGRAR